MIHLLQILQLWKANGMDSQSVQDHEREVGPC